MPTTEAPHADGAQLITRQLLMRRAMHLLAYRALSQEGQLALVEAIETQHRRNVRLFGWAGAEFLRAEAFAQVAAKPLPTGEATESDLVHFDGAAA